MTFIEEEYSDEEYAKLVEMLQDGSFDEEGNRDGK